MSKKAKKVKVEWVEIKSYYPKYTCPHCRIEFQGGAITSATVRFLCSCGQELIIENVRTKEKANHVR